MSGVAHEDGGHVQSGARRGGIGAFPIPVVGQKPHYSTKQARTGGVRLILERMRGGSAPAQMVDWLEKRIAEKKLAPMETRRIVFEDPPEDVPATSRPCIEEGCTRTVEIGTDGRARARCAPCRKRGERMRAAARNGRSYKARERSSP